MRILMVADGSISGGEGGAERVLYEEAVRLAARGHTVRVLTRRLERHRMDEEKIDNVREYRYPVAGRNAATFFASTLRQARALFGRLLAQEPVDLIHGHQPFSAFAVLRDAHHHAQHHTMTRSIPTLYTCHSLAYEEYLTRDPHPNRLLRALHSMGRKWLEWKVLERCDRVVTLSDFMRRRVQAHQMLPAERIRIIPGGADHERFRPAPDKRAIRSALGLPASRFILFTVRNLVPRMGLNRLIDAMALLVGQIPELLLIIGGAGPLRDQLEAAVAAKRLQAHVRFAGFIPESQLVQYYQAADLFILPTAQLEGFGLVTVEALAAGLPVLGTPIGATPEILGPLDKRLLFVDAEPASMAALIREHYRAAKADPATFAELGRRCRRYVEAHYTWSRHMEQLDALYQELLERP